MSLGLHLTLLIGKKVPAPSPPLLLDAIQKVEVTCSDREQNGFQIIFSVGRSGSADASEYPLLNSPLLKQFNRVIIMVAFGVVPKVLIDGVITHQQLNPSIEPGKSTYTVTGEGLSVLMDLEEKSETYPNQTDAAIVSRIILSYAQYGLTPNVVAPASMEVPLEINSVGSQQTTDLKYIRQLAKTHDHVFYIEPSDVPSVNTAYWGPSNRTGTPQRALSFNMGPFTNVNSIDFQNNALEKTSVKGSIQDPSTGTKFEIPSLPSLRPSLAGQSAADLNQGNVKTKQLRDSGLSIVQTLIKAQSETDGSGDAVAVTGELDSMRYGDVLRTRRLVGLRGVGKSYDGLYYVKKVVHIISHGSYKQNFTITREGLGATASTVVP
jgi:phage protein D